MDYFLSLLPSVETILSILMFVAALMLMVTLHEFGHFYVAKKCGVRVDIFSIGFGPKLLGFKYGGTDYRLAPIPLGGYVKIYGHDPHEESEGDPVLEKQIAEDPQSFHSKKSWQKLAIVLGGPVMNLILCFVLMPMVFLLGKQQHKIIEQPPVVLGVTSGSPAESIGLQKGDLILSVNGTLTPTWEKLMMQIALHPEQEVTLNYSRDGKQLTAKTVVGEITKFKENVQAQTKHIGYLGIEFFDFIDKPQVLEVSPGLPAEKAGIQPNDTIVRINDKQITSWPQLLNTFAGITSNFLKDNPSLADGAEGPEVSVVVLRAGQEQTLQMKPIFSAQENRFVIGIKEKRDESLYEIKKYGLVDSIVLGSERVWELGSLTLNVVGKLVTGQLSVKTLGGPVQLAMISTNAAKAGFESNFSSFFFVMAFLSLQLGIMNLLPIPVLDGGHVVFISVEALIRRPIPRRLKQWSMQIGVFLLISLMFVATFNDVGNLGVFQKISEWFHSVF